MTILVTGSASGIGAAVMQRLGRDTIGLDLHNADIICDLADMDAVAGVVASINVPLSGIAHVAGVPGTAHPDTIIAVNLRAPVALTQALLPKLTKGASIVAVSSITALRCALDCRALDMIIDTHTDVPDLAGMHMYELSKAALNRWVQRQSVALRDRNIRINSVSPGPVETPILADFEASIGKDRIAAAAALVGRHATPDDVACVIAFLLSGAARWVNGTDIKTDGGYHAARTILTASGEE